ncbi:MAG: hypothetical protein AB7S70_16955 [Hyphomicrobium sp.]
MLVASDSKSRVLAVLSPEKGAGVSALCRMLAETYGRSGMATLLVDLTRPTGSGIGADWVPGEGAPGFISSNPCGYDELTAHPTRATRAQFNNVDRLRRMFSEVLTAYDAIVVDLPAVLDQSDDVINPIAAARASDAVIMMCVTGETSQQQIRKAKATLEAAGVQIGGTVLNDRNRPLLGAEIGSVLRRVGFVPGVKWLARLAETSEFLNPR